LRVVPVVTDAVPPAPRATELRPPDRVPLLELANGIDDADLRSAILRLAAHAEAEPPAN